MGTSTVAHDRWWLARSILLGMVLGGIGVALFWHFYPGFWKESPAARVEAAVERREALKAQMQQAAAAAPGPPVAPVAAQGACAFEPIIAPASAADGKVRVEHPFPAGPRAKAKVFLRAAKKAAANGRPRDEEVALIAACRYSDEASPAPAVPLARVLGELGDRYVAAAAREALPAQRENLLARAREVLALSAATYDKALGPNAARSREAHQRVAALDEGLPLGAGAAQPQEAPRTTAAVSPPAQKPRLLPARKAVAPRAAEPHAAEPPPAQPKPKPVRPLEAADPELRQLASDLARLQAQAEAVSDDPEGLRRRAQRAQAERARCADAACLRDWYAHRREELLAEF